MANTRLPLYYNNYLQKSETTLHVAKPFLLSYCVFSFGDN